MKSGENRYALFGGSFDPPHLGHLAVAQACLSHLEIDEVIWVPNFRNPLRRKSFATATHRLQMCQLATEDHPGMAVSDIEVGRGTKSYTIETVEEILMVRPGQLWIVMGADALEGLLNWKEPERLTRLCRIAVVARPGTDVARGLSYLTEEMQDRIDVVPMQMHRASSSLVRDELYRGTSPEMMLDPKVWDYIQERGLYRDEKDD
jgi:nicotinate-nucleotide adenylyltransferase